MLDFVTRPHGGNPSFDALNVRLPVFLKTLDIAFQLFDLGVDFIHPFSVSNNGRANLGQLFEPTKRVGRFHLDTGALLGFVMFLTYVTGGGVSTPFFMAPDDFSVSPNDYYLHLPT